MKRLATRRAALRALIAAPVLARAHRAVAADFPTRPLRLLVGYAPGGPPMRSAGAIAKELEADLKHRWSSRTGAGAAGLIALDALTQSAPDGYTVGLLSNSSTTALHSRQAAGTSSGASCRSASSSPRD